MTKAIRFTRAEIRNAAVIAREQGVAVTLKPDGSILIDPNGHIQLGNEAELDRELEVFKKGHGYL